MELSGIVMDRISYANDILQRLDHVNIDGITRLRNKIKREINFLEKCLRSDEIKEEHLNCSNLTHLEAVANQLIKYENVCTSIMNKKVLITEENSSKKICIDLILYGGSTWMKVVARNRKALTLVSNGDCSFGQKTINDQAVEFIQCSNQHPYHFKPPTVIFYFANGIDNHLAEDLVNIGVKVENNLENSSSSDKLLLSQEQIAVEKIPDEDLYMIRDLKLIEEIKITKLNLGVTALIAYVSSVTNGGSHHNFKSHVLRMHAEWERARPVKPILDKLFEGKELYCCQTAADNFNAILGTLGGKGERKRGKELMERVTIVEDHPTTKLKAGGKVKERSLAIFGTGEYLKAITVTANRAFIRSALNKGVNFEVFLHESRALTEDHEAPALDSAN